MQIPKKDNAMYALLPTCTRDRWRQALAGFVLGLLSALSVEAADAPPPGAATAEAVFELRSLLPTPRRAPAIEDILL